MGGADSVRHGYHDINRPELVELVPLDAKNILDLGCGTGLLGRALKNRQRCHVTGIELSKDAAAAAEQNIDAVFNDNLNRFNPTFLKSRFDCLIFGDILEHLINPWSVLEKFSSTLTDNGCIVVSLPNIAHPHIVNQLQRGLFRYEPAGILDVTHLRFFTKSSIFQMFVRAGLKIVNVRPWPNAENPIQYHVCAVKARIPFRNPTTTILILTHNGLEWTRRCIASIKAKTQSSYKILVVDNGSTDGTVDYLRSELSIQHIENDCNHGFARGFNIGLMCVTTPYFVLANNDVLVTKNWLSTMLTSIKSDDKLLVLGVRSNNVSGSQIVKPIDYTDARSLEAFAAAHADAQPVRLTFYPRIVFFFVMIKTEALQHIGFLDEIFGIGNFEDDDYCFRVARRGYKCAFDNKVFIHHWGSQTFKATKIDYVKLMAENKAKFEKKWKLRGPV